MRRLLALSALAAALLAPAAPSRAAVLDVVARPTPVAAGGGIQAWSRWDATARTWSLVVRNGRDTSVAPVAPKRGAFDADAGLDRQDRPVVVYTRCTPGCDVYAYSVATRSETKLRGISSPRHDESSPTIDDGRVAAIRDGRTAYWRPLGSGGPSKRLRTLGSGLRSLRLRGTHVVAISDKPTDDYYDAVVWTTTLGGATPVQVGGIGVEGEAIKSISDAQIAGGGVRWLQQGSEYGGFEGFRASRFGGKGRRTAERPASVAHAAISGSRVVLVRTTRLDGYDQYSRCPEAGCQVQTAAAPFR